MVILDLTAVAGKVPDSDMENNALNAFTNLEKKMEAIMEIEIDPFSDNTLNPMVIAAKVPKIAVVNIVLNAINNLEHNAVTVTETEVALNVVKKLFLNVADNNENTKIGTDTLSPTETHSASFEGDGNENSLQENAVVETVSKQNDTSMATFSGSMHDGLASISKKIGIYSSGGLIISPTFAKNIAENSAHIGDVISKVVFDDAVNFDSMFLLYTNPSVLASSINKKVTDASCNAHNAIAENKTFMDEKAAPSKADFSTKLDTFDSDKIKLGNVVAPFTGNSSNQNVIT